MIEALHYFAILARYGQVNRHDTLGARCVREGQRFSSSFKRVFSSLTSSVHTIMTIGAKDTIPSSRKWLFFARAKQWCRYIGMLSEHFSNP